MAARSKLKIAEDFIAKQDVMNVGRAKKMMWFILTLWALALSLGIYLMSSALWVSDGAWIDVTQKGVIQDDK